MKKNINMLLWFFCLMGILAALAQSSFCQSDFMGINGITYFHKRSEASVWEEGKNRLVLSQQLGVKIQRIDFWWDVIQPEEDRFNWEFSDKVINELKASSQDILPILCYASAWSKGISPKTDEERKKFGEFVFRCVDRYKDSIHFWEVWNEPNITPYWNPIPDAELYSALLREAYIGAKRADPNAKIVGVCAAGADYDFIEDIYSSGAGKYFDILSYHHYDTTRDENVLLREICSIKDIMKRYDNADKKIWITEMGLPTGYDSGGREEYNYMDQGSWLVKKYFTALSSGEVGKIFWYNLLNEAKTPGSDGNWGLLFFNGQYKISGYAYKTLSELLTNNKYIGELNIGGNTVCHILKNGDIVTAALWNKDNLRYSVKLICKDNPKLIDAYGKEGDTEIGKNFVMLNLSSDPIYVTQTPDDFEFFARIQNKPRFISAYPGGEAEFEISLQNIFHEKFSGAVIIDFPNELNVPDKEIQFEAEKGGTFTKSEKILIPPNQACGWFEANIRIKSEQKLAQGILKIMSKQIQINIHKPFNIDLSISGDQDYSKLVANVRNISGKDLSGKLIWNLPLKNKPIAKPTAFQKIAPNQIWSDTCSLKEGTNETQIESILKTDDGCVTTDSLRVCIQNIVNKPPIIDGKIVEWTPLDCIEIANKSQISKWMPDETYSTSKSSATVYTAWDSQNCYIAAYINDETPRINPFKDTDIWKGDCLEIYLGLNGATSKHRYPESNYHLGIAPGDETSSGTVFNWTANIRIANAEVASSKTRTGWTVEAKIPLNNFKNFAPSPKNIIGFDVSINNMRDKKSKQYESQMIWNGNDKNFIDPSKWGAAIIIASRKIP